MLNEYFSYGPISAEQRERTFVDRLFNRSYVFVYFFALQLIVNCWYGSYLQDPRIQEPLYRLAFLPLFWSIVLWMALSSIRSRRLFGWIGSVCAGVGAMLFVFESFLLEAYHSAYSGTIAFAIMGTNPEEASEFCSSTMSWSLFVPALIGLFCVCIGSYLVHLLVSRLRIKHWIMLGMLSAPLMVGLFYFYPRMLWIFYRSFDGGIAMSTLTPIERIGWATGLTLHNAHLLEENIRAMSHSKVEIESPSQLGAHTLVLVLGESLRSDMMHIYGNSQPNTPRLDSLVAEGNLAVFGDAVSCSESTGGSISEMMAFRTVDMPEKYHEATMLPVLMRSAGYSTYWLSRQEKISAYVRTIAALARLSDVTTYIEHGYDDALLPHMRSNDAEHAQLFQVMHLNGSHPAYQLRYPKDFARFRPEDMQPRRGAEKDQTLAWYHNTVLFADHVAASIMRYYEDKDAIVVYVSDHGQALYDDPANPDFAGHALSLGGISVPLMIYISPSMAERYPELKERIFGARNRPIMTDILPYAIAGLSGIRFAGYKPELDFLSPQYDSARPRIAVMGEKRLEVKPRFEQ